MLAAGCGFRPSDHDDRVRFIASECFAPIWRGREPGRDERSAAGAADCVQRCAVVGLCIWHFRWATCLYLFWMRRTSNIIIVWAGTLLAAIFLRRAGIVGHSESDDKNAMGSATMSGTTFENEKSKRTAPGRR